MSPRAAWTLNKKIKFAVQYGLFKLALIFEVKSPKCAFFFFEMRYSLVNLWNSLRPNRCAPVLYYGPEIIHTTGGIFRVRKGTHDAAIISPAFERQDMNFLKLLLQRETLGGEAVGFLDIGANIGAFSVRAAGFSAGQKVKIWAFEPIPENRQILQSNLELNNVGSEKATIFPYALGNRQGEVEMNFTASRPGDSAVSGPGAEPHRVRRIPLFRADDLLKDLPKVLVVKIDVEGKEREVLEGLKKTLSECEHCWLCLEDIFDRDSLWTFVQSLGFEFQFKFTPYNSWWLLKNPPAGS